MKTPLLLLALSPVVVAAAESPAMPPAQQNALVQKYCAVCHSDAHPNGLLSFEHFDAAHPDPGLAAIMAAKLKTNALGASGQPLPDRATQDALLSALSAEAAGAGKWFVSRGQQFTASIVQELPSSAPQAVSPDLYRLVVTCQPDSKQTGMQLEWSPDVPKPTVITVTADGQPPVSYKVEGSEKMGNGQPGTSGPGAIPLSPLLPEKTLTVSNLFPGETVVFPVGELPQPVRQSLSKCLAASSPSR